MILLLHLTNCSALLCEEQLGSKHLLAQIFNLVGNRLRQNQIPDDASTANSEGQSKKANLVYCLLMKLRYRVWQRARWSIPHCPSSHVCALQNPKEPGEHYHPDIEGQKREQSFLNSDEENMQDLSNPWNAFSGEPYDTIDIHEYEDVFEQYLHPGLMG